MATAPALGHDATASATHTHQLPAADEPQLDVISQSGGCKGASNCSKTPTHTPTKIGASRKTDTAGQPCHAAKPSLGTGAGAKAGASVRHGCKSYQESSRQSPTSPAPLRLPLPLPAKVWGEPVARPGHKMQANTDIIEHTKHQTVALRGWASTSNRDPHLSAAVIRSATRCVQTSRPAMHKHEHKPSSPLRNTATGSTCNQATCETR